MKREFRITMVIVLVGLLAVLALYEWRYPGLVSRNPRKLARTALRFHKEKEWKAAERLWRAAISRRPHWFVPHYGLWLAIQESKAYTGMETSPGDDAWRLAPARDCAPRLFEVWAENERAYEDFMRGYRLYQQKRWGDAIRAFETGLEKSPKYVRAHLHIALAYLDLGDADRALLHLRRLHPHWRGVSVGDDFFNAWLRVHWAVLRPQRPAALRKLKVTNYVLDDKVRAVKAGETVKPHDPSDPYLWGLTAARGQVWVSWDYPAKLWTFDAQGWRQISKSALSRWAMSVMPNGSVWIGSDYGSNYGALWELRDGQFVNRSPPVPPPEYTGPALQWSGDVWINSQSYGGEVGVYRLTGNEWRLYGVAWTEKHDRLEDAVWLFLGGAGKQRWRRLAANSGIPKEAWTFRDDSGIRALGVDRRRRLWCGSKLFDGTRFVTPNAESAAWRKRAILDVHSRLWGEDEIVMPKDWDEWNEGLLQDRRKVFVVDRHKRVWVGTRGGLALWTGRQWVLYTKEDGLLSNFIRLLAIDDDVLWVGVDEGLSRLDIP